MADGLTEGQSTSTHRKRIPGNPGCLCLLNQSESRTIAGICGKPCDHQGVGTKEEQPPKRCYLHCGITTLRRDKAIVRQSRRGYVVAVGLRAAELH